MKKVPITGYGYGALLPRKSLSDVLVPSESNTANLNPIDNLGPCQMLSDVSFASKANTAHLNPMIESNHLTEILTSMNKPASTPTSKCKEKSTRNRRTPANPLSNSSNKLKQLTLTQMEKTSSDRTNKEMHQVEDSLINNVTN